MYYNTDINLERSKLIVNQWRY